MSHTTDDMKAELQKGLESLQTMRDEIRVRIHLAGMEAKDAWNRLEPKLYEAERLAEEVSDASRAAMNDLVTRARELRSSLKD
ncbi:MAG TPA: hypothetical protein VLS89_07290 [Candidatus Nanopelagicales bacterium]|nr:hypothetical protein [Candidatus Nanopelagicales bacterium]